jgi:NAD(P)-dependent dehydrogenase (short-subunit alcohol dehydrogenase family)
MSSTAPIVVVTGANGFVGARICEVLIERGASVRAVVRRPGTAPELAQITEVVGEFSDPGLAASVVSGAASVVTTVHPMGSDRAAQHRVAVEGTPVLARAAAAAGVELEARRLQPGARPARVTTDAARERRAQAGFEQDASAGHLGDEQVLGQANLPVRRERRERLIRRELGEAGPGLADRQRPVADHREAHLAHRERHRRG